MGAGKTGPDRMTAQHFHRRQGWTGKILRRLGARLHWLAFALWGLAFVLALMPLL
jgi:hypothetical protein